VNFLQRVDLLRERLKLTVGEVHALIGVKAPFISMIRSGHRQPGIKLLRRLEEAEKNAGIVPLQNQGNALPATAQTLSARGQSSSTRETSAIYGQDHRTIGKGCEAEFQRVEKLLVELISEIGKLRKKMEG
jgi:transcriptional regulator with XRE-family HTH domain